MTKVFELEAIALQQLGDSYRAGVKSFMTPVHNVLGYGAKGDGVANDSVALAAAIGSYRTVVVAPGTYVVDPQTFEGLSSLRIVGIGNPTIQFTDGTRSGFRFLNCSDVVVEGLRLGYRTTPTVRNNGAFTLEINNTNRALVREVEVYSSPSAGMFFGSCNYVTVERCNVHDTLADGIHSMAGGRDIKFVNNTVENTGDDALVVLTYNTATAAPPETTPRTKRVVIAGNSVYGSKARGILLGGTEGAVVQGNTIRYTRGAGISVHWEPVPPPPAFSVLSNYDFVINGNALIDCGQYGVDPNASEHGIAVSHYNLRGVIMGNSLFNTKKIGILCRGNANIIGNLVDGAETGLVIASFEAPAGCYGVFNGNVIRNTAGMGIAGEGPRSDLDGWVVSSNTLLNCVAPANVSATLEAVISFKFSGALTVTGNQIIEKRATQTVPYAIRLEQLAAQVSGNTVNKDSGFGSGLIKRVSASVTAQQGYISAGTTSERPAVLTVGVPFFDTTLAKLIIFDGAKWVDTNGVIV